MLVKKSNFDIVESRNKKEYDIVPKSKQEKHNTKRILLVLMQSFTEQFIYDIFYISVIFTLTDK